MPHFVLIACVAKKASAPTAASGLYLSPLFRKAWRYAESIHCDGIFVLSAKHGLVGALPLARGALCANRPLAGQAGPRSSASGGPRRGMR